ncbi:carbohydrate-binding protein [Streptomyces sp. CBMA29]|uniref:carbohydrate-binding protein n=1 Tax=Streptomyces sp. CBMA29 TaxID=1896314 RepID=UPI001661D2C5|nr:carbohydrate-binding protein [Streptomyces sp. CBMA29]
MPVEFSAGTMAAEQWDYGVLHVTWSTPQQAATAPAPGAKGWTQLRLIRSSYGIPADESDGLVLVDEAATGGTTAHIDTRCTPGRYYYYALYVATPNDPYQAAYTYTQGDLASYAGLDYQAIQPSTGQAPDVSPLYWTRSYATTPWVRVGGAVGLAPQEWGNSGRMYDLVPRPYRVQDTETTATDVPVNSALEKFMAVLGFYLDVMRTENRRLLWLNDTEHMSDAQLQRRAADIGIARDLPALPHLRRRYVARAAELADSRGSASGVAELVNSLTGWTADVSIGYNRMLDVDQAQFQSPVYPVWDKDTPYLVGDYVTSNGFLYQAASGPSTRYYATNLTIPSGSAVSPGGSVIKQSFAVLSGGSHYLMTSSAQGQWMELTFSVATSGVYDISFASLMATDYATVTVTLNGSGIPGVSWPLDFYSKTLQESPAVYLGQLPLFSGNNVLRFTATGKNPVSGGYKMSADYWVISQVGVLTAGHAPTGSATSNSFWTYIAPGAVTLGATSPEWNPLTGGQSTWYTAAVSPVTAPQSSQSIALAGAAVGRQGEGLRNALRVTTGGTGTGDLTLQSLGPPVATAWNATTAYPQGTLVTYAGQSYRALVPTTADQPDTAPTRWARTQLTTSTSPDPQMVQHYGIPLPSTPPWSGSAPYAVGAVTAWRGHQYEATLTVPAGQAPTGYATDNLWWAWTGRDVTNLTFSMWQYRSATATGQYVRAFIEWFNEFGVLLASSVTTDTPAFLDRFEVDQTYPRSTGSAPPGTAVAAFQQTGVPIPWNTSIGDWTAVDAIARPTSWYDDSAASRKVGRMLWFNRSWVATLTTGDEIYATFISGPADATYEQGVVFRFGGGTYLLASRTRLTKCVYTTSGGAVTGSTITALGTYTGGFTFTNGMRIRVVVTPTSISVYNVTGKGPALDTLLLTVANTDNATQYGVGVLERSP